jgi:hypothetical protein
MVIKMNEKVEQYIEKQDSSLKEIILKVRDVFLKILPDFNEQFA